MRRGRELRKIRGGAEEERKHAWGAIVVNTWHEGCSNLGVHLGQWCHLWCILCHSIGPLSWAMLLFWPSVVILCPLENSQFLKSAARSARGRARSIALKPCHHSSYTMVMFVLGWDWGKIASWMVTWSFFSNLVHLFKYSPQGSRRITEDSHFVFNDKSFLPYCKVILFNWMLHCNYWNYWMLKLLLHQWVRNQ